MTGYGCGAKKIQQNLGLNEQHVRTHCATHIFSLCLVQTPFARVLHESLGGGGGPTKFPESGLVTGKQLWLVSVRRLSSTPTRWCSSTVTWGGGTGKGSEGTWWPLWNPDLCC